MSTTDPAHEDPAEDRSIATIRRGFSLVGVGLDGFGGGNWDEHYARELPPLAALAGSLSLPYGCYELVDFLTSSAATVEEGFERLAKYLPIVTNETTFEWTVGGDSVEVGLVNASGSLSWFSEEWTLGATIRGFRGTLGASFTPIRLDLQRPNSSAAGPMLARLETIGAFPIRYAQPRGGMVLPLSLWRMRQPSANSRLHNALEAHAAELLSEKLGGNSMAAKVRRELVSELRGGEPTVQRIAKKLATTARTLQRRLAQENTAFQTELDQVRAQLAKRYLTEEGLSVTEVAFLLGFSEASAFARAHRRWYGRAPRERSQVAQTD